MKKVDVLMLIKTSGLEYDDRLRKECKSINDFGFNNEICVLEDVNIKKKSVTEYNTRFESIRLTSRRLFSKKRGLVFKTLEMYLRFIIKLIKKRPKTVWIHNIELIGILPILIVLRKIKFINQIIWDQHELPPEILLKNHKTLFYYFIKSANKVIVANMERKDYLSQSMNKDLNNIYVLDNFVDERFIGLPIQTLPKKIERKLKGEKYILAQGGANSFRYIENIIEAIMNFENVKLIIVGPYSEELYIKLENHWGKKFENRIIFTGLVPQIELVKYIDNSIASIVLYAKDRINNKLCSPNRLYQAISRGIPVIVGDNPPMKAKVDLLNNGVVIKSDGKNVEDIKEGISVLFEKYKFYKKNAEENKNFTIWEVQEEEILKIINNI